MTASVLAIASNPGNQAKNRKSGKGLGVRAWGQEGTPSRGVIAIKDFDAACRVSLTLHLSAQRGEQID
jgi:hypothetical protein